MLAASGNGQGGETAACGGYDALSFKCAPTSSLVASIDKGKAVVAVVAYHEDGLWETPPLEINCATDGSGNTVVCIAAPAVGGSS